MSNGISLSDGWSLLKNMLGAKAGTSGDDITNADVEKFLKEADLNKDGKVTQDEFKKCCKDSSDYKEMEEKYLETFKKIAELDKINETISEEDIEAALAEMEETEDVQDTGNTGGTTGPGNTPPVTPPATDPPQTDPPAEEGKDEITSTIPTVTLTGNESSDTLRTGRSDTLDQLNDLKKKKADIEGEQDYQNAENQHNTNTKNYDDSLNALADIYEQKKAAGETLTAEQEAFLALETKRDELSQSLTDQKTTIDDVNTQISEAETAKGELETSLGQLEPPSESLKVPIYNEKGEQTGVDTSAYDRAMDAYEAQKKSLEAQIADKESELTDLEAKLVEEEGKLADLEEQVFNNDAEIVTALENLDKATQNVEQADQAEVDQIAATKKATEDYLNSWSNLIAVKDELMAQVNADIEQLRANLKTYDDALDKKDEEANANLPEGMHSRNGFVYEGEGENERLMLPVAQSPEGPDLPAGYKVDAENGTVVDEQGNVVGKVVTTESDQNGDGKPDNVESIYLYADSVVTSGSDRTVYANLGIENSERDSFASYLKSRNIDINTATDAELTTAVGEYNKLNEQKNEFIRLYNQFSADENLAKYLDDSYEFTDSDARKGTAKQSFESLYHNATNVGAIADEGEQKMQFYTKTGFFGQYYTVNSSYNSNFEERIPEAIEYMQQILAEETPGMRVPTDNGNI